jgi:mRNA degradation ribonuclease J1/J2
MSALKIIPLGGLGEIGMNCMLLEYENEILVVDCGLLFSDLDQFGVEFMIPDFTYLKAKSKVVWKTNNNSDTYIVDIRMKKDSIIWANISVSMISGAAVLFTTNGHRSNQDGARFFSATD